MDKRLLTLKEFASQLGVSQALVRKWQRTGHVRFTKLGRCTRFPVEEADRLIAAGMQQGARRVGDL